MSAQDRTELAAAVNTVEGVTCTPYYRDVTKAGHGCVVLARMTPAANGFGFVATWQIRIALPDDIAQAERWIDEHHDEIADALKREWVPTEVRPARLDTGDIPVNGVIYEGTR